MTPRRTRLLVFLGLLALVASACGQKAGVADQVAVSAGGFESGDGDAFGGSDAGVEGSDVTTPESDLGGGTGGAQPGTPTGGAQPGAAGSGGQPGGGAAPAPGDDGPAPAGDRTGISASEIVIGIHAPVTGAAPFPQNSFNAGKDVYWKFINDKGGVIGGKKVRVVFADDKFDPQTAVQVCRKMVEQDKVFLLVGGGGADQITACARYANSVGVPYLSAGVNQEGLDGLRGYFAVSATYAQQSPLLAQMIAKQFPGKKVAILVSDTPSFEDGESSMIAAAEQAGLDVVHQSRINKNANETQALAKANEMRGSGAEVVYFLGTPVVFLRLAAAGAGQGYTPQYVGPGITSGLNTVAELGCPAVGPARFFSPFPQTDVIGQMDPDYQPSYQKYNGEAGDDIGIALWGINKMLHNMFEAAGPDMSRQSFVATLESGREFATGVFPPVKYDARNHFGGTQVHVLQADCNARVYKTIARFVAGF